MAAALSLCSWSSPLDSKVQTSSTRRSSYPVMFFKISSSTSRRVHVLAKKTESEENIPSWAQSDSDEPPPWARENAAASISTATELPFFVYLLTSAITAIAAIGSIFEYSNQKPVFGVIQPDSIFYAPLLGFFVFTGIPLSGFLWFKSVQAANKEAEEQDQRDGYR